MKRFLLIPLSIILLSVLIIGGCAQPAPAPAPAPGPPPAEKAILLKFAYDMPPFAAAGLAFNWWAEQVQEKCGGKVKIDVYGGGSLLKQPEAPEAVKEGVAEIAFVALQAHAKLYPVNQAFALPAANFPSNKKGLKSAWEAHMTVRDKFDVLQEEFSDVKLLMWAPLPANFLISTTEIHVPADMKGMKVGCEGYDAEIIEASGGAPVHVIPPDLYMNLQKGVVDACTVAWMHVQAHKLHEVATHYLDHTFGHKVNTVQMNMDTWNSLPPDVQDVLMGMSTPGADYQIDKLVSLAEVGRGLAIDAKGTIITPTPEESAKWEAKNVPVTEEYLADLASRNIADAPAIFDELMKLRALAWK